MKIKPAEGVVALKPTKPTTQFKVIEVVEKDAPEVGKVIAIGKGKLPVQFEIGSLLAYRKFGEFKFWLNSKEVLFVKFEDLLAVLEK